MENEQFDSKLKELEEEYQNKLFALYKEYALSNSPLKEGDIAQDHIGKIKVDKIQIGTPAPSYGHKYPYCVYYGVELKKDGTPTKKGDRRGVYQSNLNK